MKYLGPISHPKDLTNKEFVENSSSGYALDDSYVGASVTFDWLDETRPNWQKHWSGASGAGSILKQIDYSWNGSLCTRETFTFPDKTFQVDYTYTGVKITGINITEV